MLWIKSLHIIFMVSWFAGIFYLPRIFVNLAMTENDGAFNQLNIMARKLYRFITPFMILTIVFGVWLTSYNWDYYKAAGWFHTKIALMLVLVVYHFICGHFQKQFAEGRCSKSHVFFRWFNEFPVVILIAIIILVVVKPF
ncbi:CopD family protein [Kangiella sp. HZ709]|uniref:CopD family protein n=1 Tax=Kangiella sp. HZ709 TaxID=2666328 RepID=UPI0012AEFE8D|nr:CopD family protein [Kangiella sp. HZ709]MRX27655.1 TIGR00701 family protein [Kangiella sp. HZ709]